MYLVYKTDTHHSYASRDVIGACFDLFTAINICKYKAEKEGEEISKDDWFNLKDIKQTQNYAGEGEFFIEFVQTNKLL